MSDSEDIREKAQALAAVSEDLESAADLKAALESSEARCRTRYVNRIRELRDDDGKAAERMEAAISGDSTQRLLARCAGFWESFMSTEMSTGAGALDPFGRAWPRLGVELKRQIAPR